MSNLATLDKDTTTTIPVTNELGIKVDLYDSFSKGNSNNYYGTLKKVGSVLANGKTNITPILHNNNDDPLKVYIAFDTSGKPIGRYNIGSIFGTYSISITTADQEAIKEAFNFVNYIATNKDSDECKKVKSILGGTSANKVNTLNAYFKSTTNYKDVTFSFYMLALTYTAQTAESKALPLENKSYRLSELCDYLGGEWPSGFPDVIIKNFVCSTVNNILELGGLISLSDLPFENAAIGKNILSLFPVKEVDITFMFDYQLGLSIFGTKITFQSNNFVIPIGGGDTITIERPTVELDINPLFKFVVFKALATIPFDIFNKKFDTDISMVIDNIEAEVGVVIKGDHSSLVSPPILKGVHFDEFGVGMGIIFEPPGFALGLEGKFHIGNNVPVVDDTYVMVCELENEIPKPLYLSFYVAKLDLPTLVKTFTNTTVDFDFPVSMSDLSFVWCENPMEPVVLPNGSLSNMAFGCSSYLNIFSLEFYGALEVNLQGIKGTIEMSEFRLGELFKISGDGKGVSIKVDASGNPIPNNQIAKTQKMKQVIANAKTKQIVTPGGPELTVDTSGSPYLTLDASFSLFDIVKEKVAASITNSGINFELDYSAILQTKMQCTLKNYHNFSGTFTYAINQDVPLPHLFGYNLGSIDLIADCDTQIGISTSTSKVTLSVGGKFDFEDSTFQFGLYDLDVNISKMSDLIDAIGQEIIKDAGKIFKPIIGDASKWAIFVAKNIVKGIEDVAEGLKTAFKKTAKEVAQIMHDAGFSLKEIASGLKTAFNVTANELTSIFYNTLGESNEVITETLKGLGYSAKTVATVLHEVLGLGGSAINGLMKGAGYSVSDIENAFKHLGGDLASYAEKQWNEIKNKLNPTHW